VNNIHIQVLIIISKVKEIYQGTLPGHRHRVHLHKIPAAAGHPIQLEEESDGAVNQFHYHHHLPMIHGFLRRRTKTSRTSVADLELLHEKASMYGAPASSTRETRLPCLNDGWDSSLGPCSTTVGDRYGDLAADLGGEEEVL
jgi:hypothetical protein